MYSGIIGAATLTMAWFVQPVLMYLKTPVSWYGVIWTVLNLTVGFAALRSDRVDNYFGPRKMGILILVFIVGGYVSLAFNLTYAGLAILFVFLYFPRFCHPHPQRIHQPNDFFFRHEGDSAFHPQLHNPPDVRRYRPLYRLAE